MKSINKYKEWLFKPVDSSILGFYRIVFGFIMLVEFITLKSYFVQSLSIQKYKFTYDGFDWMVLLPPDQLNVLFIVLQISAVLFILGAFYRINAVVQFIGWTYLFLSERGHYNNHYYFYCLILLFFIFVNGDSWAAIKRRKTEMKFVPYWQLFIFQLQIFIVYFYGGIAKLNMDWLLGHPMANVLPGRIKNLPDFMGEPLATYGGALFVSYTGLFFDLFVGFFLFSRKWRRIALVPILCFHLLNHFLWSIGTFPWAMIFSTFIFYNPDWPRLAVQKLRGISSGKQKQRKWRHILGTKTDDYFSKHSSFKVKSGILVCIVLYFAWQFLFPLRHHLYKGDVAWTGEGHLFAWRMMLSNSDDAIRMRVDIPRDKASFYIDLSAYMHKQQLNKVTKTPKMMLKFVHFIRDEITKSSGVTDMNIHLEMYKSVNYRKAELLNDTTLNYANVKYETLGRTKWILPWDRGSSKLRVGIYDKENWKEIAF